MQATNSIEPKAATYSATKEDAPIFTSQIFLKTRCPKCNNQLFRSVLRTNKVLCCGFSCNYSITI